MPQFQNLHPTQFEDTVKGAQAVEDLLEKYLKELTGMAAFTFRPYAGAHGELTGLMIIKSYHHDPRHNGLNRTKVIVPDSAHGTNPASAAVCGFEIIEVKSRADGQVDLDDLKRIVAEQGPEIAAMMMTNPNTLGLFETQIPEITKLIHDCGGLMYYDGANLNPMLGACRPADMGFDVMHINLHKTFSTPHGGGGPGSGPVGVRNGIQLYLHRDVSPYHGNFGVTMKALAYILSLGREHIKEVGPLATLNANYIKESLKDVYELPIDTICCHEFVFDGLKDKSTGVTTMDVAKRLLDYGYHAPTIYFPLLFHESLMIEPTENESKETLDGFIAVMRKIAEEAKNDPDLVDTALMHMSWDDFVRSLLVSEYEAAHLVCGADFRFGYQGAGNCRLLQELCDGFQVFLHPAVLKLVELVHQPVKEITVVGHHYQSPVIRLKRLLEDIL